MGAKRAAAARLLTERQAVIQLGATIAGLAAGGLLRIAGLTAASDIAWLSVGGLGLAYAIWTMVDSLRRHRV